MIHSIAEHEKWMALALREAEAALEEKEVPVGAVVVHEERVIGRGHNRRIQEGSVIKHGEMDALESAGRLPAATYQECMLYTTLSPCPMCSGAIRLYGIPKIIIGENETFIGDESVLRESGVDFTVLQHPECIALMRDFIRQFPEEWNEDIGEK